MEKLNLEDLTGMVFDRLTVIKFIGKRKWQSPLWLCQCKCGTKVERSAWALCTGRVKSCGCLRLDAVRKILKVNHLGQKFGRLTVIADASKGTKERTKWLCQCDCGIQKVVPSGQLVSKQVQSCGCLGRERRIERNTKHGQARRGRQTPEFIMWNAAKQRARRTKKPFTVALSDISIPPNCPVFGTPLHQAAKFFADGSPSLDCKDPKLGYIPGNVWVISWRANRLKSDASLDELRSLVSALEVIK